MFGFGDATKVVAAANEFGPLLFQRSDRTFRPFVHFIIQDLIDNGLTKDQTALLLGSDKTKWAFATGICAEQLLAARNVMGNKNGRAFEKVVFELLGRVNNPELVEIFAMAPQLLEHNRGYPLHMRLHTLNYMCMMHGLEESAPMQALEHNPILQATVAETIMAEGDGIVRDLAQRHGLRT